MLRIIQKWDLPLLSSKNGKSHGNCHWPDYFVQRLHYLQISHWPLLHKIVCSVKNLGSLFYLIFTLALLNVHSSTAKYLNPFSWHKQGSIYRYFLVSPPPLPSRHRPLPRVAVWATCPALLASLPCPACSASLVTSTCGLPSLLVALSFEKYCNWEIAEKICVIYSFLAPCWNAPLIR